MLAAGVRLVFRVAPAGCSDLGFAKLPQTHLARPHSKPLVRLVSVVGRRIVSGNGPCTAGTRCRNPAAFALALGWEIQSKQKHERQLWVREGVQMAETDTSGRKHGILTAS